MKSVTLIAGLIAGLVLTLSATSAFGGGYRHGGYYAGHYSHYNNYNRRHHGNYYRGHSRHRNYNGEYLIGGLILGSLISHAYHQNRDYPRHSYTRGYTVQPSYTRVVRTNRAPVVTGRRLFKDIDGNCFERREDTNGDELLEALPAEECVW